MLGLNGLMREVVRIDIDFNDFFKYRLITYFFLSTSMYMYIDIKYPSKKS